MSRFRVPACLLLLILLGSIHVAQEAEKTEPEPDPSIELNALYKVEGRQWAYRIVSWDREWGATVERETARVDSIDGDEVSFSYKRVQVGGGSTTRGVNNFSIKNVEPLAMWYADKDLPVETIDTGFREFECRRHRETVEGLQVTTWVSTEYHPLIVKQTTLGPDSTKIRKLTDFQSREADPYLLYRKEGRSWTTRSTIEMQGMAPMISYTRYTVTEVGEKHALYEMEMLDKDMQPMTGMDPMESRIEFITPDGMIEAEPAVVPDRETKEVGIGEFDCYVTDVGGTKTWSSVDWPGLVVAIESKTFEMELVEFDLGHDEKAFYRTEGNYYVRRDVTELAGTKFESETRYEITKVEDNQATCAVTSYDGAGNAQGGTEETVSLDDDESEEDESERKVLLPYAGQREELITVEAGTFPAIIQESEVGGFKTTTWTFNGIVVCMETEGEGVKTSIELIELAME